MPSEEFFLRPAQPEERALYRTLGDKARLGWVAAGIGAGGTFVSGGFFLHQIVVIAPIFEELFKFGLALLLVVALRASNPVLRLLLAALPGLGFGVLEHFVTYRGEPDVVFAFRALFHSGSTMLSMAVFTVVEPLPDLRTRLASTVPSTVIHWANNLLALLFGVAELAGADVLGVSIAIGVGLAAAAHGLAWFVLLLRGPVARMVERTMPPGPRVVKRVRAVAANESSGTPGPPWE